MQQVTKLTIDLTASTRQSDQLRRENAILEKEVLAAEALTEDIKVRRPHPVALEPATLTDPHPHPINPLSLTHSTAASLQVDVRTLWRQLSYLPLDHITLTSTLTLTLILTLTLPHTLSHPSYLTHHH